MIRHTRSITCKIIDHKIIYNIPVYFDEELASLQLGSNLKIMIDKANNTLTTSITDGQLCIRRSGSSNSPSARLAVQSISDHQSQKDQEQLLR